MKTLREQFDDDYTAVSVPADNRRGFKIQYVYCAPWYSWGLPESELKQKKTLLTAMSVGSLLIFLLTGIQWVELNQTFVVEIAGTFALCFHVLELFSIVRFLVSKYRTDRMTYTYIDRMLKVIPLLRGVCLLAAAGTGTCYMLQYPVKLHTAGVTAGYLFCAIMALYIYNEYRKIPLKTEKNDTLEKDSVRKKGY